MRTNTSSKKIEDFEPDPEMPSAAMWKQFNADIDAWLLGVHAHHPIEIVVKPIDEEYSTETDAWHDWTCARIPTAVLPKVEEVDVEVARYVAEMWKAWVQEKSFDEQLAVVGRLGPRRKGAQEVQGAVRPEGEAADAEAALGRRSGSDLATVGGDHAGIAAMACASKMHSSRDDRAAVHVLARRARIEAADRGSQDRLHRARACGARFGRGVSDELDAAARVDALEQGRLDEAKPVVHDIVAYLESYKPEMLSAAMRYHAARGEHEIVAMLYHAGMMWFTSFTYEVPKTQAVQYGKRAPISRPSSRAGSRAGSARRHGTCRRSRARATGLSGSTASTRRCSRRRSLRSRPSAIAGSRCGRSSKRRPMRRLHVRSSISSRRPPTPNGAARIAGALHTRAPLAVFELLDRAIANEHRGGYRYPTGGCVNAIIS